MENNQPEWCFYLFAQKRLLKMANGDNEVDYMKAKSGLTFLRVSKKIFPIMLKEMEKMGLIKLQGRRRPKITIVNPEKCNEVENINKYYHKVGIW